MMRKLLTFYAILHLFIKHKQLKWYAIKQKLKDQRIQWKRPKTEIWYKIKSAFHVSTERRGVQQMWVEKNGISFRKIFDR